MNLNANALGMTSPPSVDNAELVPRRIFVGGFDDSTTEFELETFFKVSVVFSLTLPRFFYPSAKRRKLFLFVF